MPKTRTAPIRVLLISSRVLIRSGLSALLRGQPLIQLVGELSALPESAQADVLIWDVGAEKPRPLPTRFILLLAGPQNARAWLDAGAGGIVLETSTVEQWLDAIRQVARGETFLPRELAQQVVASLALTGLSGKSPVEPL